MPEKGARRLGVATETTGVVRGCNTWEPPKRWPFWNTKGRAGRGVKPADPHTEPGGRREAGTCV